MMPPSAGSNAAVLPLLGRRVQIAGSATVAVMVRFPV